MLPIRAFNVGCDPVLPATLRSFGRLFDELGGVATHSFAVDVRQSGDEWLFEAEMPGVAQEDINVTVENNVLTISGETRSAEIKEDDTYHIRERQHGQYSRSFSLPSEADGDSVSAALNHGVLTVRVATREEAKPRRIEVK